MEYLVDSDYQNMSWLLEHVSNISWLTARYIVVGQDQDDTLELLSSFLNSSA